MADHASVTLILHTVPLVVYCYHTTQWHHCSYSSTATGGGAVATSVANDHFLSMTISFVVNEKNRSVATDVVAYH